MEMANPIITSHCN